MTNADQRAHIIANRRASAGRSWWTPGLIAAAIAMLGLLWLAATMPIATQSIGRGAGREQATPAPNLAGSARAKVALADLPETTSRPLFNATRRPVRPPEAIALPAAAPQAAAPVVTTPPLQAQLLGLARAGKRGLRALVRPASEAHGLWLGVGEELQGWKLAEIKADKAIFQRGERTQELVLADTPAAKPSAQPAADPVGR